jgi:hypothetical protein
MHPVPKSTIQPSGRWRVPSFRGRIHRSSSRALAILGCALFALGLSPGSPSAAAPTSDGPFELTVKPGGFGERCVRVERDGALAYEFAADGEVDFNLHYHRGQEISYPVRRAAIGRDRSRFVAPATGDYCLMWENRSATAVRIDGRIDRPR